MDEIAPRVYQYAVGQERGYVNGAPLPWTAPDGTIVEPGCIHAERGQGWRDFKPELRRILPAGVQGFGVWGPDPDPWATEDAGSYRLWSGYCPAAFLTEHTNESVAAGWAWVQAQTRRGCHYSQWIDPRQHYIGAGYSRAQGVLGGFHMRNGTGLYGRPIPEFQGIAYGPSGAQVPHAQHGTIDALVWFALTFNSYTATLCAVGQWQAMASDLYAGGWGGWNARAFGWFFKASAYLHELARVHEQHATGLCPVSTEDIRAAIDFALECSKARNFMGCPCPKTNEHMGAMASESVFFAGVGLVGKLDVLEIVGERPLLLDQIDVDLSFISSMAREDGFFDDDRAPREAKRQFNIKSVKGSQSRFTLPGLLRADRLLGTDHVRPWADATIAYCDSEGTWGGKSDRSLWAAEVGLASEGAP